MCQTSAFFTSEAISGRDLQVRRCHFFLRSLSCLCVFDALVTCLSVSPFSVFCLRSLCCIVFWFSPVSTFFSAAPGCPPVPRSLAVSLLL